MTWGHTTYLLRDEGSAVDIGMRSLLSRPHPMRKCMGDAEGGKRNAHGMLAGS